MRDDNTEPRDNQQIADDNQQSGIREDQEQIANRGLEEGLDEEDEDIDTVDEGEPD